MNQHTPPSATGSIADAIRQVAMVAEVSTSAIGLTRVDKSASRKADQDHAAKSGAGTVTVKRFAGAEDKIKKIMDLQAEAQANLKRHSMVWGQTKRRLLPNSNFQAWIGEHTRINDAFEAARDELIADADNIIQQAAQNIGSYQIDLPTKQELMNAFELSYQLEPIPDPQHFAMDALTQQAEEHLRHQFEENVKAAYNTAVQDTAKRLAKPLENLADRMDSYEKREREVANGTARTNAGTFKDTIIENVQEIASVFGNLNVLGDPVLDGIAKKVQAFTKVTPDVLRKRSDIRQAVAARAKEVLKDLDGILVR